MSEKVHEVPESILKELFLAARGTARRDYITSSLSEALDFAEKVLSGDATPAVQAGQRELKR